MIGMLRGKVWEIQAERLVIDVQGVGYLLTVTAGLLAKAVTGQEIVVYTHVIIREDELALYGFSSAEEKRLFLDMLSVSGIGPKVAIAFLSAFSGAQLISAVASEDVSLLTKVPGVGKKTAQRLVLELREKFKGRAFFPSPGESLGTAFLPGQSEALQTLLALGFSLDEGRSALTMVQNEAGDLGTEEQVKRALRALAAGAR